MIEKLTDDERSELTHESCEPSIAVCTKALRIIDQLQDALDKQFKLTHEALEFALVAVDRLKKAGK